MRVIKNNSKPIRVICTECGSEIELNRGELQEKRITLSMGEYKRVFINECPCCKTKEARVQIKK